MPGYGAGLYGAGLYGVDAIIESLTIAINGVNYDVDDFSFTNVAANDFLPRTWRVKWQATDWGVSGSILGISCALNE